MNNGKAQRESYSITQTLQKDVRRHKQLTRGGAKWFHCPRLPGEGPRLSEERQVSMVITQRLQSRETCRERVWNENGQAGLYS